MLQEILDSVILFFVVQQSFGSYLISAVAVVGAQTRQPAHEDGTDVLSRAIGLADISKLTKEVW